MMAARRHEVFSVSTPGLAGQPHGHGAWLTATLLTVAILVLSPLAGLAAARTYAWSIDLGVPGVAMPGGIDRLLMTYEAIYTAVLNLTMIALTMLLVLALGGRPAERLALQPPAAGPKAYLFGLGVTIAATVLWFAPLLWLAPDAATADFRPYPELMARERSYLMPPILCLLAPVAEEVLFRGFLFPALATSRLGPVGAALASTALWAALHVDRTGLAMMQLFFAGLLLTFLLVRTGSLRVPILCHVLFNTGVSLMVIVLGIPA